MVLEQGFEQLLLGCLIYEYWLEVYFEDILCNFCSYFYSWSGLEDNVQVYVVVRDYLIGIIIYDVDEILYEQVM